MPESLRSVKLLFFDFKSEKSIIIFNKYPQLPNVNVNFK